MANPVTVYTTQYCPHCARAKDLLSRKGVKFQEIDVTEDRQKRQELEERYGWMTVPIVLIGDRCIGGADELQDLERKGDLDRLLRP